MDKLLSQLFSLSFPSSLGLILVHHLSFFPISHPKAPCGSHWLCFSLYLWPIPPQCIPLLLFQKHPGMLLPTPIWCHLSCLLQTLEQLCHYLFSSLG